MSASSDTELLVSVALLVLAIVLLVAITPSPEERSSWQVQQLAADAGLVLNAAVSYLQDLGYAIDSIDRSSGFVKTQYASRGQLHGGWGVVADILAGEARYAATVQVLQLSTAATEVRVNLIAEEWTEGSLFTTGHWSSDPLAYGQNDYLRFFEGLRAKLGIGSLTQPCVAFALRNVYS
jgi:hypothetical protein